MRDPIIIPTDDGLFCLAGNFHIDPWRPVATAVITHAHAGHARTGSEHYLTQHHSLPSMRYRLGEHCFNGMDYGEQHLDEIAKRLQRSKGWVINQALSEYIEKQ